MSNTFASFSELDLSTVTEAKGDPFFSRELTTCVSQTPSGRR